MADPKTTEQLWWLSFADESGFLGVALVRGASITEAARTAWAFGFNPGGEVLGYPIPAEGEAFIVARDPGLLGRLLDKSEAMALGEALDLRFDAEDHPVPNACTAWVWQPCDGVWCYLVKCSDGRIEGGHEVGEGADERAVAAVESASNRLGCSSVQTLLVAPWEVARA